MNYKQPLGRNTQADSKIHVEIQGTPKSQSNYLSLQRKVLCVCCAKLLQLCLTLGHPMDCGPPGCSVCWILQARILERLAMPSLRWSSQPRGQTLLSPALEGRFFTTTPHGAEVPQWRTGKPSAEKGLRIRKGSGGRRRAPIFRKAQQSSLGGRGRGSRLELRRWERELKRGP